MSISTIKKASDGKYDILKIVMAFFVVAIHMELFSTILYPWLRMAVPLFFIMTGYFFFLKLDKTEDYKKQVELVRGFVVRNLKLYAFWFVCLLPVILVVRKNIIFGHGFFGDILALVKCILLNSTFTASWYIMSSIYGVLIIFFLLRKLPNSVLMIIAVMLYCVVTLASSYAYFICQNPTVDAVYTWFNVNISMPANSFLVAVVWLICGKCFADGTFKGNKVTYAIVTILSAVALYIEWRYVISAGGGNKNDCYFMLMPFCLGVFGFVNSCDKVTFKYAVNLRRCSTVVFVTHGAVARIILAFFRNVLHIDPIPLCYVLVLSVCIGIYILLEVLLDRCRNNKLGKILQYAF